MIPSVLARQVQQGVEDFLRTTFPFSTPYFHGLLERLFETEEGLFKGPYLSIQLPFRQGTGGPDFFPAVPLKFKPYLHQEQAFRRLGGTKPRSTLVATGTGSGKTESFLVPILDHCHRHRGERGIKAILIYPMNALATDQARRLAGLIWNNPELKGQVTAGLFVGDKGEGAKTSTHQDMGPDHLITDRDRMRLEPPDLLLTNYKMLDYLLLRPRDYPLWQQNGPETLRYLVVDELHTFDGAQGSDLACLLRRLKARLQTPERFLCCVGTSATLGGKDAGNTLRSYAQQIFGEPFDPGSIITESRLDAGAFLEGSLISERRVVPPDQHALLQPDTYDTYDRYLCAQAAHWFDLELTPEDVAGEETGWRVELGKRLRSHSFFRNLLTVLGGQVLAYDEILYELRQATAELREAAPTYQTDLLGSLVALVSAARHPDRPTRPFLDVRVQLWLRELRRMVCSIEQTPMLRFADDLPEAERERHLPIVHCRDCGSTGWAGLKRQGDPRFDADLRRFYVGFFEDDPTVTFVFPETDPDQHRGMDGHSWHLCGECLRLSPTTGASCSSCGSDRLVRVFVCDTRRKRGTRMVSEHNCPYCGSQEGLTILGSQAASLTSVLIAQLFTSTYNDDKKLITFSDSVQDASHRASFFGARTYRFNFRSALQQFVQAEGTGVTLADLPTRFVAYWTVRMEPSAYLATFLAPDMAWFEDYGYLQEHGKLPTSSTLKQDVDRRIGWEVRSEYGFRARIGRTLEKTSSSAVHLDQSLLEAVVRGLLEPLRNEIGELHTLTPRLLRAFLVGLIAHLKNAGALYHPELDSYLQDFGNAYLLNRRAYLPGFGAQSRAPVFLTTRAKSRFEPLLSQRASNRTWCEAWALKTFAPINPLLDDSLPRLYPMVLKTLVAEGILHEAPVKGERVWGLRPEALRVTTAVTQMRCAACGHNASVAEAEQDAWHGAPCLRFRCTGHYIAEPSRTDYYRQLYAAGDIERIFADEHTGLLERSVREELEVAFTREVRYPWDPNLLSCTPTLEMGIDIGNLSTVILCSVPPSQANYLQRIGRAGRRDGNALNLAIANGRPHDLFFFAEPKEMLAGHVESPRVYLAAPAVLERQFTAFCFDRWVETGLSIHAVPFKVGAVLDQLKTGAEEHFPNNLLRFIAHHQTSLLDAFLALFEEELTPEARTHLQTFVAGDDDAEGSLRVKVMDKLWNLRKEQDALRKKTRALNNRIKRREADPAKGLKHEEEIAELRQERQALNKIIRKIRDTQTYNFFTDEGLLPNYAFPEAGVLLRSIIYRKRKVPVDGESPYDQWVYEYERPAVRAIRELAPGSRFYAEGRSVQVDQVNLELSNPEAWRFCDQCDFMEPVAGQEEKLRCPRCESPGWSDVGQQQQLVQMKQVIATTSDRKSRTGDDRDDREPAFFVRDLLVDFAPSDVTDAYRIDDDSLPFGFEFLRKATFREVNFGPQQVVAGETIQVAGQEIPRQGFRLCRHCGKVQPPPGRGNTNARDNHTLWCSNRGQDKADTMAASLYLYREFSSEAIRLLLPMTTFGGSQEHLHSFIAALQLGLKARFGRVDHLRTTVQEEPVPGASYRKQYLVLYDTVPGGTGYLKQLMHDAEPMMAVFEAALTVLTQCPCNLDPGKDGCYRCLYAYRTSYDMPSTSRRVAIELLTDILQHRDALVQVPNLRGISVNAVIESALERMFIEALRRFRTEKREVKLRKEVVRGKPGWFLQVGGRAYYIEPQVSLGPDEGADVPSRADFVLWPAGERRNGAHPAGTPEAHPVVIFTDGYRYHQDRIGQDLAQRMALVQSGRFHVWSLTWQDVQHHFESQGPYYADFLPQDRTYLLHLLNAMGSEERTTALIGAHGQDSFDWLFRFLEAPDRSAWRTFAFANALTLLAQHRCATPEAEARWQATLAVTLPHALTAPLRTGNAAVRGHHRPGESANPALHLLLHAEAEAVKKSDPTGLWVVGTLPDTADRRAQEAFEKTWTGFLRLYNLFQFLPNACFVSETGLEAEVYHTFAWKDAIDQGPEAIAWDEAFDLSAPEVHPLLQQVQALGGPVPVVGYPLTGPTGRVVAEAELAWPQLCLACLLEEQDHQVEAYVEQGWQALPLATLLADPDTYFGA